MFVRETPFVFENRELWLGGKNSNKFKCNAFLLESFWRESGMFWRDSLHAIECLVPRLTMMDFDSSLPPYIQAPSPTPVQRSTPAAGATDLAIVIDSEDSDESQELPESQLMEQLPPRRHHGMSHIENIPYPALDSLELAMRAAASAGGFTFVRSRSKKANRANDTEQAVQVKKVWYRCIHSGSYTSTRKWLTPENRKRQTSTCRSGCLWTATATRTRANGFWLLKVRIGDHNHGPQELASYASVRHVTSAEEERIKGLTVAHNPPKAIAATLNAERIASGSNLPPVVARDIYNVKSKIRNNVLQGRTPIEALLDELVERKVWHRTKLDSKAQLTSLIFVPTETVHLLRQFHTVLLMDCTYKSNRLVA